MFKKRSSTVPHRPKMLFIILIHLIALLVFSAGLCVIRCNPNFHQGIAKSDEDVFEDSQLFMSVLNSEVADLYNYVHFRGVFESADELDTDAELFALAAGDGFEEFWTVQDVLDYAAEHGYSLDNNYKLVKDPNAPESSSSSYPVTWRSYRQTEAIREPGASFRTLDSMTEEILTYLGDFYRAKDRFAAGRTNLHYRIYYEGRRIYTNDDALTSDNADDYGRYCIIRSGSILPENNLPSQPEEIRRIVEAEASDSEDSDFYIVFAVDTKYPADDAFAATAKDYNHERSLYFAGMVMMFCGLLAMVVTFILIALFSGAPLEKGGEIRLQRIDHNLAEQNFLIALVCAIVLIFFTNTLLLRVFRMVIPVDYWSFAEKLCSYVITYLCLLIPFYSAVRSYKAGLLWQNSFLRQLHAGIHGFLADVSFAQRSFIYFTSFAALNVLVSVFSSWLILRGHSLFLSLLALILLAGLLLVDGWYFRKLYKKQHEMDLLSDAIRGLDSGHGAALGLEDFEGHEAELAATINNISAGLEKALNDQVRSERMKAELITNVSHDIKTPLTSIINYIDLMKRTNPSDPELCKYLEILDRKSQHLKTLTEDLVEASKASTGNVQMSLANIDFVELAEQTNGEFEERFESLGLTLIAHLPPDPIIIHADGQHLWRVLENLYNNAGKYAAPNSRVYVDITRKNGVARFTMKNISANPLNISPDELTERFVRGDVSRTTEGSGLGLSIARSLTELQQGRFQIEIDGDYFKASVSFPIVG